MNLKPLNDRMVVEPIQQEQTTSFGIILPESAKEKPMHGKVLAVGPGVRQNDGTRTAVDVVVGDTVLYAKYAGTEIKIDGNSYLIMKENDILAVVEG